MSRLRIPVENSGNWDPVNIPEIIDILFPKIKYKTEQEHLDVIKKNKEECSNGIKWYKFRKENKLDKKGYVSTPWRTFSYTEKE